MTKKELAQKLTKEARELNLSIQRSTMRLGGIYKRVRAGQLYHDVGFEHFNDWLTAVGGAHQSQAHALATTYEELEKTVPNRDIERMPQNNARDLNKVPERKRTKELVEAACEMTNAEFRQKVDAMVPGLHLEASQYIGFQVQKSAVEIVKRVIATVMQAEELPTQGAALEWLCSQYELEYPAQVRAMNDERPAARPN